VQEKTQYVHNNPYTRPGIKNNGVRSVVWHYTASPGASAQNIRDYFDGTCVRTKRYASAHDTIDNIGVIHMIPHDEEAYHAHDHNRCLVPKLAPNANLTSIGVEICINRNGNLEKATYDNAVKYGAKLCQQYALDPLKDFYRHFDITRKNCPAFWVSNPAGFEQFKHDVKNKLNGDELTMSQYQELKNQIDALNKKIDALSGEGSTPDDYAEKAIEWAQDKGVSTGKRPQGTTKREEVITMIWNYHEKFGCCICSKKGD
jgi:N-acetylmuramoyl-L-alanine amidase CwlA